MAFWLVLGQGLDFWWRQASNPVKATNCCSWLHRIELL